MNSTSQAQLFVGLLPFPTSKFVSQNSLSSLSFTKRFVISASRSKCYTLSPLMSISETSESPSSNWIPLEASTKMIDQVQFNKDGLVPAIAQQYDTGEVLMMAYMNEMSLRETLRTGRACYWSRSRNSFWRKGDTSGQIQVVHELRIDCDGDTILIKVDQLGVACHTGRRNCFYFKAVPGSKEESSVADWEITDKVLMDPNELYERT